MARLRAVYRELWRVGLRLNAHDKQAFSQRQHQRLTHEHMRWSAMVLAKIPPFSSESRLLLGFEDRWTTLVHMGARTAISTTEDELFDHGLAALKELQDLEHQVGSSAAFESLVQQPTSQWESHAALAALINGHADATDVREGLDASLERFSRRCKAVVDEAEAERADGAAGPMATAERVLRSANHVLFVEHGLHVVASPSTPAECLVHSALELRRASPLVTAVLLAALVARCAPSCRTEVLALPRLAHSPPVAEQTGAHTEAHRILLHIRDDERLAGGEGEDGGEGEGGGGGASAASVEPPALSHSGLLPPRREHATPEDAVRHALASAAARQALSAFRAVVPPTSSAVPSAGGPGSGDPMVAPPNAPESASPHAHLASATCYLVDPAGDCF